MATTPSRNIPLIDEGVIDVISPANDAFDYIDGLLQTAVLSIEDDPPVSPANGDQYIVGTGTGAWAGKDDYLARYVAEGDFWRFYEPGVDVMEAINLDAFEKLAWNSSAWIAIGGLSDAPSDGSTYGRKDGAWEAVAAPGIPQNSQSADYTLVLSDANKHLLHPSADTTGRTFTIPANASVAFPIGTAVTFVNQDSAGSVSIAITTDTMRMAGSGATGTRTLADNGIATALKITSTEWIISGTGLT